MRINELLVEQQLDELGLADVGRWAEKGIGGLSKAAGYVAGIPGGVKQQFQTGKARATAGIGGTLNRGAPTGPDPAYTQALQNYQTHGTATAPSGAPGGAATATGGGAGGDPASMRKQAQTLKTQSDDLMKQADAAEKMSNKQATGTQPPAGAASAAGATPPPAGAATPPAGSLNTTQRIEPTLNQPAAAGATPPPAGATPPPAGAATPTAQWPADLPKFNTHTGQKFASPEEAKAFAASPEAKMSTDEYEKSKAAGGAPSTTPEQPKAPPEQPKTPEQTRQEKQAAATGTAQQQMAANPAPAAKPTANFGQQAGGYGKQTMNAPAAGMPTMGGPQATQATAQKPAAPGTAALLQPKPSFAPAGAVPGQFQVQGGPKPAAAPATNPALDARKAALAKSKAATAAGSGITGAIKGGKLGEELEESFYSNFLGRMI